MVKKLIKDRLILFRKMWLNYCNVYSFLAEFIEKEDTERFVRESNLDVIKSYVENDVDDRS